MGANSQQGWALLLFVAGFTFLVAGFFALGPLFSILGLVCLVASVAQAPRAWRAGEQARTREQAAQGKAGAIATNRSRDMSGEDV